MITNKQFLHPHILQLQVTDNVLAKLKSELAVLELELQVSNCSFFKKNK